MASPRRREILRLVWSDELAAGEIHASMPDVTFGAVSLQLRALVEAGLVDVRSEGRHRFYRARREAFGPVGRHARTDVGRRPVAAEASGRARTIQARASARQPTEKTMTEVSLAHALDRTILIRAERERSFRFFTDNARWASWWGAGSTIEARRGGRVFISYPGGTEASGEVLEIDAPERIVFTYGYVNGAPIVPGGSLVTISLEPEPAGTLVRLTHAFAESSVRDQHVQGWRYQLSLFANVVANEPSRSGHRRRSVVRGLVRAGRCGARCGRPSHCRALHLNARSIQRHRRPARFDRAPGGGASVHARHANHAGWGSSAVSGDGARGLDCPDCRRSGPGPGHECVHVDARWAHRGCDGLLECPVKSAGSEDPALLQTANPRNASRDPNVPP